MKEYSIAITGLKLGHISKITTDDGTLYEGSLILSNDTYVATMEVKPQTREWWLEKGKAVGGEFEQKIILHTHD